MPLRPAKCYTHFTTPPYTRKEYIHGVPQPKITKFEMGNPQKQYEAEIMGQLIVLEAGQIRHNALEAARLAVNKYLSTTIGQDNYLFRIKLYPHQVLRENKMMAFAGADRLQDGMRQAFGKPIGTAARVFPGHVVVEVFADKKYLDKVKEALRRGGDKMPLPTRIVIKENKYRKK
ncbi:MAG: 50S ribosomal protein L16 [Desulfurococcales archaeon]|nr:50S ribosomal protein L16 [Desulfurococcales archaeon]